MNSFGITDRGKVRRENQDSFLIERIDEKDCLIARLFFIAVINIR